MPGRRYQSGENHGTPFHTSTKRVGPTHPPAQLAHRCPREHRVPAAPPHHAVAVAPGRRRQPTGRRRAMEDLEAGVGPPPHELVGVELGTTGVGVVEVAPRQHVDPPHAPRDEVAGQFLDRRSGARHGAPP